MNNIIYHTRKIASILLEVDFKVLYKIMFNMRILPSLERNRLILDEIIGGRYKQSTLQVMINKKVILNIFNQKKASLVVISTNTTNCYD